MGVDGELPVAQNVGPDITEIAPLVKKNLPHEAIPIIIPGEINITPDRDNTFFEEQVTYDAPICTKTTSKGLTYEARLKGRVRKNLSDVPEQSSSVEIDAIQPRESDVKASVGSIKVDFTEPQPQILRALYLQRDKPDQKIVMITAHVRSNQPRMGIATSLFTLADEALKTIVSQTVETGIFPQDTLFVRVYDDQASLKGWTADHVEKRQQAGGKIVTVTPGKIYTELITPIAADPGAQALLRLTSEVKKTELLSQIASLQTGGKVGFEELDLPNFDMETGESIKGMPIVQLRAYLDSLKGTAERSLQN